MRLHSLLPIGAPCLAVALGIYAADPTFDFVVPWDDSSATATDLSGLIPRPAGARGFVRTTPDGHLAVDDGRIRFWGTNMTFGSAFPDKGVAATVAAHLAKFGVNMVRFHHMDTTDVLTGQNGIWTSIDADRTIDASQLDRLDYFIAQLKERGIYSDVNLLVGRPFNGTDGDIPDGLAQVTDWKVRAAVGFFDVGLQRLQMQYATDLLSHVNPYTGLSYAVDPAVAFVEINNENGLAQAWMSNQLDGLPSPILGNLRGQWNAWLATKYGSQDALESAWGVDRQPAGGEMLQNGGFGSGFSGWNTEQHESARATFGVDGGAARIEITATGTAGWHVQLNQGALPVGADRPYTLTFKARASEPRTIEVDLGMAEDPWAYLGFSSDLPLTSEWRSFSFTVSPSRSFANARINFSNMGLRTGTVWIDDVSFRPGGVVGLGEGESLERRTIDVFRHAGDTVARTQAGRRDWLRFLLATEESYWTTMRRHLKETLDVRGLVVGTIVGTSTPNLMAQFDAVDSHAYWRHPEFPSEAWSSTDWFVRNDPMVNDQAGATMAALAMKRVIGKPHMVTEYNHPSPNAYEAEAFPMLATYGALQDFDAVFNFDWNGGWTTWDTRMIQGYFSVGQNPIKLAALVPSAAAFLRGDIAPAQGQVVVSLTREDEVDQVTRSGAWTLADAGTAGVNPLESLRRRIAIQVEGALRPDGALAPGSVDLSSRTAVSDTGQVTWDAAVDGRGVVWVDAPLTKLVYGFAGGRAIELSGLRVEVGRQSPTALDGFAVVGLTSMDGATLDVSRRMVLTVVGGGLNTGARLARYGGETLSFPAPMGALLTFGDQWGIAPSRVERVPATISIPGSASGVQAWALDERGGRRQSVRVYADDGRATIDVGPDARAVWYEITR
jgi:hypothetical protein